MFEEKMNEFGWKGRGKMYIIYLFKINFTYIFELWNLF